MIYALEVASITIFTAVLWGPLHELAHVGACLLLGRPVLRVTCSNVLYQREYADRETWRDYVITLVPHVLSWVLLLGATQIDGVIYTGALIGLGAAMAAEVATMWHPASDLAWLARVTGAGQLVVGVAYSIVSIQVWIIGVMIAAI